MFKHLRANLKNVVITGAFLFSVASLVIGIYGIMKPQKRMVSFDIKGTVQTFIEQTSRLGLSEERQTAVSKKFDEAMGRALKEYTRKHGVTIFVGSAVVDGASDITGEIREDIARIMHQRENK